MSAIVERFPITEKPELDDREYRYLRLQNGLRAVLVSDPQTEKVVLFRSVVVSARCAHFQKSQAAAALDVHVGHFCDPDEIPGLAHFLGTSP
jgi:insulysin